MSSGFICDCADQRHTFDPRSKAGVLGITSRCRNYATDQERGGLCPRCQHEQHVGAAPEERDDSSPE